MRSRIIKMLSNLFCFTGIVVLVAVVVFGVVFYTAITGSARVRTYDAFGSYVMAAKDDRTCFLELRRLGNDELIDDVVFESGYMVPSYNFRDVAHDDKPELLVKTCDGGTGLLHKTLTVFRVTRDELRQIGEFTLKYRCFVFGDEPGIVKQGQVDFVRKDRIEYALKRTDKSGSQSETIHQGSVSHQSLEQISVPAFQVD